MAKNQSKPMPQLSAAQIERFWSYVDKRGPDECWPWRRMVKGGRYGRFSVQNFAEGWIAGLGTHRLSYFLNHGVDPLQNFVLHKCDFPPCCNPSHLFLGDAKINRIDCRNKGRITTPSGPDSPWFGKPSYNTKITPDIVRLIRQKHAEGMGFRPIARLIGTKTRRAIKDIVNGKIWSHVK